MKARRRPTRGRGARGPSGRRLAISCRWSRCSRSARPRRSLRLQGSRRFSPDGKLAGARSRSQGRDRSLKGLVDGADPFPSCRPARFLTRSCASRERVLPRPVPQSVAGRRRRRDEEASTGARRASGSPRKWRCGTRGAPSTTAAPSVLTKDRVTQCRASRSSDQLKRFSSGRRRGPRPGQRHGMVAALGAAVARMAGEALAQAAIDGWALGPVDLDTSDPDGSDGASLEGRSALHTGTAETLAARSRNG